MWPYYLVGRGDACAHVCIIANMVALRTLGDGKVVAYFWGECGVLWWFILSGVWLLKKNVGCCVCSSLGGWWEDDGGDDDGG